MNDQGPENRTGLWLILASVGAFLLFVVYLCVHFYNRAT